MFIFINLSSFVVSRGFPSPTFSLVALLPLEWVHWVLGWTAHTLRELL